MRVLTIKFFLKKMSERCLKPKNDRFLCVGAKKESVAKDTTLSGMTEFNGRPEFLRRPPAG